MLKPTQLKIIGGITIFVAILAGFSVYFYFSNKQELVATNNVISVPTKTNQESTEQIKTTKESNSQTPVISEEEKKEKEDGEKKRLAENTQRFEKHMEEWDDIVANNRYAIFNRDVTTSSNPSAFYHANQLYHGDKLIIENINTVVKEFGLKSSYENEYSEWFQREDANNVFIYVIRNEFPLGVVEYYFVINKNTGSISIKSITEMAKNVVLIPNLTSFVSPDKTRIGHVYGAFNNKNKTESVWIYDLIKNEDNKIFDISTGYSVGTYEHYYYINRELIKWINGGSAIKITSIKREWNELSQEYQTVATSTDIVNIE